MACPYNNSVTNAQFRKVPCPGNPFSCSAANAKSILMAIQSRTRSTLGVLMTGVPNESRVPDMRQAC
jgi:hypothetical protein